MSGAVPVIAIDGPSASGKGTVAERVARALGFRLSLIHISEPTRPY